MLLVTMHIMQLILLNAGVHVLPLASLLARPTGLAHLASSTVAGHGPYLALGRIANDAAHLTSSPSASYVGHLVVLLHFAAAQL